MLTITTPNYISPYSQAPKVNYKSVSFSGARFRRPKLSGLTPEAQIRLDKFNKEYAFIREKKVQLAVKRSTDVVGGTVGMVLSSPVLLAASIAIKLESKGPILFRQPRVGKDGKLFTIYKLRTMAHPDVHINNPRKDGDIWVQNPTDPRITKVGQFLRKYSIDELPQFINIIKGDMSLVGPRPCPLSFEKNYEKLDPNFVRRYTVKPGAQLKYPFLKDEDVHLKVKAEKKYLDNWSLLEDAKQICHTLKQILTGKNY